MSDHEAIDHDKHVTRMWGKDGKGHYTHRENMYMGLLRQMLPQFQGGSVLEVGPGTGLFAQMMFDRFDIKSYTILDLEAQIEDSKKRLGPRCDYVVSQDYLTLFFKRFDLFVSNVCLPETPVYYQEALGENVLPNCKFGFVIGGDPKEGGDYNSRIRRLFKQAFVDVSERETGYCGTFAIAGW